MADILRAMRRYPEALHAYDISLACDPLNEWASHNKSLALLDAGPPEEAHPSNQRARCTYSARARTRILGDLKRRNQQPPNAVSWL
jgi:hypothetical protein